MDSRGDACGLGFSFAELAGLPSSSMTKFLLCPPKSRSILPENGPDRFNLITVIGESPSTGIIFPFAMSRKSKKLAKRDDDETEDKPVDDHESSQDDVPRPSVRLGPVISQVTKSF
jgi:hypothetical protein